MTGNQIGDFLRARRDQVRPEQVGLRDSGRRRVPGLRRDELAMLAGISTEYYTRLEQGRDQNPSAQVLDAVARALNLDDDARTHLHQLATPAPVRPRVPRRPERVRPSMLQLIDSWQGTPAFVQGPHLDIMASNAIARALSPVFTPGTNLLRATILDPAMHALIPDWEVKVETLIAGLRSTVGPEVEDPRLMALVGELAVKSPAFARIWSRHDVRPLSGGGTHHMRHPAVGELELAYDKFAVNGTDGLTLVIYHAEPGSSTEQSLALLSTLAADITPDRQPRNGERSTRN
ncbi:helix-turn-helix transcriptional regulator [Streptomyces sp. SID3212]|uniref:helix-turn-helix domain-containing protein n=1 Tax=Streptomyces sp. SID3212 TaxID=2690259 RepID=UPI0013714ED3|nr:helix-turn-helix transcriptional regulator [Streptomyces sp. SID3212]MYV54600.1 helix-turn-helix domain-containing protein [Streptomyces sp. SID3212]